MNTELGSLGLTQHTASRMAMQWAAGDAKPDFAPDYSGCIIIYARVKLLNIYILNIVAL